MPADVGSCKCVAGPAKVWCVCLKGLLEQFSLSCSQLGPSVSKSSGKRNILTVG